MSGIEDTESESGKAVLSVEESPGNGEEVLSKGLVGGASAAQSPTTAAAISQENASNLTGFVRDNNVQQQKRSDVAGLTAGDGADGSAGAGVKGDTPVGTVQPVENLGQDAGASLSVVAATHGAETSTNDRADRGGIDRYNAGAGDHVSSESEGKERDAGDDFAGGADGYADVWGLAVPPPDGTTGPSTLGLGDGVQGEFDELPVRIFAR